MSTPDNPHSQALSGAEIVIESLIRFGVRVVFGLPGGASLPLYEALFRRKDRLRHILVRHEQGAAFMAQGLARHSGRAGVCFASSGPGATNLITGIADAFRDSIPMVAITAQVSRHLIGTDAFQEIDTRGMCLPISKHVFAVGSASELLEILPTAFDLAEGGRPGPVVIDIPKDVQQEVYEFQEWPRRARYAKSPDSDGTAAPGADPAAKIGDAARELLRMIASAERPMILAGGGVIQAEASRELCDFARCLQIPVSTTLMGLGLMPADDPLFLGMPGMHAAPWTNHVLEETDLLICIGARFDDRATGRPEDFCARARIAHIDIDASEIDKIKATDLSIVADARAALASLLAILDSKVDSGSAPTRMSKADLTAVSGIRRRWLARIDELRERHPLVMPGGPIDFRRPLHLVSALGSMLAPDAILTTDVGQHQMWVAQVYPFRRPRSLITSGGLGTMGFGLPAAIGVAVAAGSRQVLCVSGDGSILMNLQELATLAELNLNVKILVLDNGHLGLVRQQQELFYNEHYHGSRFESQTDFAALARAFGIVGVDLVAADDQAGAEAVLRQALDSPGPALIRAPAVAGDLVLPMVPAGAANRDMIEV
ncbi:MAG: biosynthetic-type acetolactate synthase large subunit [bacterium]|nr:biosynthetic-type acetolactate synthase large subunit [bacterium]